MRIIGISDASYKLDDYLIGGVFFILTDDAMRTASLIYWKSQQIGCVCHSSKDAKTLTISKMVEDMIFTSRQLELLLYGDYKKRIKIDL